jgi:hypothetical protein
MGAVTSQGIIDVFTRAAILHQPGFTQVRQMTGNPGLTHAENLLQLEDGEFFLLQKEEEAEPCFVGEKAQRFDD